MAGKIGAPGNDRRITPTEHCSALALAAAALTLAGPAAPGWAAETTELISVGSGGAQGNASSGAPSISASGRFVAFSSAATNLVPGDTNRAVDVFVRDRLTHRTTRVSVRTGGTQGDSGNPRWGSHMPAISADGRFVAFHSRIPDLVGMDADRVQDVFVHDRRTRQTQRVSVSTGGAVGNGDSDYPHVSADGRFVAFTSRASNLVPGDTNGGTDVFIHDRQAGTTARVSVGPDGREAVGGSFGGSLSADGRVVAFESPAGNLVPGDTNNVVDVFVRDRPARTTTRVSVRTGGGQASGNVAGSGSYSRALSADGRVVAFASNSPTWSQATPTERPMPSSTTGPPA